MNSLRSKLTSILAAENAVLDPGDAKALASVIVRGLPPVYAAAPDLLAALHGFLALWPNIEAGIPAHPDVVMACNLARAAIARAEGRAT